ncbi:hypothetical protein [Lentzea aerocolonigenes]|uniref:hypothetical protein n=1 Tax=Lentzea aerocolonigenes TaxID=68170 RepID=UPI0004C44A79|nr:hypothetical protein [Lentzea aerocolonigenes]MCP2244005.1 Antibiotic biosynthesis monooxygenase [Lentzea aerocolonigenes]
MPQCVEFVRFRVKEGHLDDFLARRAAAVPAVRRAHPDLVGAPVLAEHADGSWTDVWIYRTAEAAERANAGAGDIPEFLAMADLLEDVQIEAAGMPDAVSEPEGE